MTQITYIKSALSHSSAFTAPEVALTEFGLWSSIKKAFKKYAKPLAAIVGIAAMTIGVVMVIWAMTGIQDKEVFFHILGFAEGTLVGQVVNYYFGSAKT